MQSFISIAIVCAMVIIPAQVQGHSWIECTNYQAKSQTDLEVYNPELCNGFPRCANTQKARGFGWDTGFDFRPLLAQSSCQCSMSSNKTYTEAAPMATYTPGQRVCLAYPSKNHVAAPCTNQYIPDTTTKISRTVVNPTSDPEFRKWPVQYEHLNGKHENGVIDYKGFQNCPKFCSNMDKSLCTMCFNLEKDLAPGKYTFQWEWNFNTADDAYSTCWEATVV